MENGQVHIILDDRDAVTHSATDISAIIPDKLPDTTMLKKNSHVIVSCDSPFHHIGFVNTTNHDMMVMLELCVINVHVEIYVSL